MSSETYNRDYDKKEPYILYITLEIKDIENEELNTSTEDTLNPYETVTNKQ